MTSETKINVAIVVGVVGLGFLADAAAVDIIHGPDRNVCFVCTSGQQSCRLFNADHRRVCHSDERARCDYENGQFTGECIPPKDSTQI